MAMTDIPVSSPKTERSLVLHKDFGDSIQDAVERLGISGEVIFSNYCRMAEQDVGNATRRLLNDPANPIEAIEAKMADWKPGVKMGRSAISKDPIGAFIAGLENMDDDALEAEMARIQEAIAKKRAAQ